VEATPVLAEALRDAHARGARAHPSFAVGAETFARSASGRIAAFLGGAGVPAPAERVAAGVRGAAVEDLYLAVACEERVPGAWEAVAAQLSPPLLRSAARRGAADPDALVQDVLGALALEASGTDPRPLLSTYAGQGSLVGFATLLLARRMARDARSPWTRRRRPFAQRDPEGGDEPVVREAPDVRGVEPAEAVAGRDAAARFDRGLERAFLALTPRERLALVLKHRDGLAQQEVARVLGIGPPRVSRLLASAVDRLRDAVGRDAGTDLDGRIAVLADVLARRLATCADVPAPPGKGAAT
jgi:RNA polymerase sigma factor (sigma-70 family)